MSDEFVNSVIEFLSKETSKDSEEIKKLLEKPKDFSMGDLAFPCFSLSKEWSKSPNYIASELSSKFEETDFILETKPIGPFLNFVFNKEKLSELIINKIRINFNNIIICFNTI